jgi:prolyl 4-hydroxylase
MTHTYTVTDLGSEILLLEHLLDRDTCRHVIEVAEHCHGDSSDDILALDARDPMQQSTNRLLSKYISIIQAALHRAYNVQFPHAEGVSIQRYLPGQQSPRQIDNIGLSSRLQQVERGVPTRDVSIVGYLNDDFAGGETFFDRQGIKVTPQAGSAIVFPAYYTHPHQSLPVRTGKKYAWTSWLYH